MKLFRSFSIYTLASFLSSAIGFILLPYLSFHLTPYDYGVISIFNTYVSILAPLMSVMSYSYLNVEYYRIKGQKDLRNIVSSIHIIPTVGFIVCFLVFVVFNKVLPDVMEIPSGSVPWVLLIPVIALFVNYNETFTSFLVIEKRAGYYGLISIVRTLLETVLTIIFISEFKMGWEGRLYAWLIVVSALLVIGLVHFIKRKLLSFRIQWQEAMPALIFGLPVLAHSIGKFVINQSDRLFISKMVSVAEAGIYNVGYQLGSIILIFCAAFSNSFSPFLYERLSKPSEEAKREIVKVSLVFIFAMLALLLLMIVLSPWFIKTFLDKDFYEGVKYIGWVGLAYWFWGIYLVFAGYLFFLKKTKFLTFLAIFNVVVNIVLNYIMIKAFGALGAAYATALSFFLTTALVVIQANRVYPMDYVAALKHFFRKGINKEIRKTRL